MKDLNNNLTMEIQMAEKSLTQQERQLIVAAIESKISSMKRLASSGAQDEEVKTIYKKGIPTYELLKTKFQ